MFCEPRADTIPGEIVGMLVSLSQKWRRGPFPLLLHRCRSFSAPVESFSRIFAFPPPFPTEGGSCSYHYPASLRDPSKPCSSPKGLGKELGLSAKDGPAPGQGRQPARVQPLEEQRRECLWTDGIDSARSFLARAATYLLSQSSPITIGCKPSVTGGAEVRGGVFF